jgi:hypothetical protein
LCFPFPKAQSSSFTYIIHFLLSLDTQGAYDGAALVYSRNQALSSVGKPDPAGHAGVMTFTTDGTNINFFTHYAAPSENGTLKYYPSNSPRGEIFEVLFITFQE